MIITDWKNDIIDLRLNIRFEFLKNYRQKRIVYVSLIAIVLPLLFYLVPLLSGTDLPEQSNDMLSSIMGFTYLVAVINAIFFGGDAINSERHNKTALIIYPMPQRRTIIYLGKLFAQMFTSWITLGFYYATSAAIVVGVYGIESLNEEMLKSYLFVMIYMSALLSIAFFYSSSVKSPPASMMLTFFTLFMLLPIASMLMTSIDVDNSLLISNYSGFITSIFRFPSAQFAPGASNNSDAITIEKGINLSLIYSAVLFTISWFKTINQEV